MSQTTRKRFRKNVLAGCISAAAIQGAVSSAAFAQESQERVVEEVVVISAQRKDADIMDVPISVTNYTSEQMDIQGIRQIEDISRLTPSLVFTRQAGSSGSNSTDINIRGISSNVGSATTAIYIDDTPIQIRNIGYWGGNPYPRIFDLERVEVLRGPQGTQFGASAMGGAVRFITPQPEFGDPSLYARAQVSFTDHGDESYEAGIAGGMQLSDTVAVRGSIYHNQIGGYIDQVEAVNENRGGRVLKKDINSEEVTAIKLAATWRASDALTITPSLYYQKVEGDSRDEYWENYTDSTDNDYRTGVQSLEPMADKFLLPSLMVQYDFETFELISNTSYFDREQDDTINYLRYQSFLRSGDTFGDYSNKVENNSDTVMNNSQKNFVQEIRLQSYNDDSMFDWAAGFYYSKTEQTQEQAFGSGRTPGSDFPSWNGSGFDYYPQVDGKYSLYQELEVEDEQTAVFASVDWKASAALVFTAAARLSQNKFDYWDMKDGPLNSGTRSVVTADQKETAFTPKVGVTWTPDDENMFYSTLSKGYRPGGAQPNVNTEFCGADLAALGLSGAPSAYDEDSLWAYEVGSKNDLFNGALKMDLNLYYIEWSDIQQEVDLPTCSLSFIGNLSDVTGKGVDASFSFSPLASLEMGFAVGYNDTTYDDDVYAGNGVLLKSAGQRLSGPRWSGNAFLQYEMMVMEYEGYFRMDYDFTRDNLAAGGRSGTFGYDPDLDALPGTNFLSMRVGARLNGADVSLFVDNVTNSDDKLARGHDGSGAGLYYVESYRPMTLGITATYRY
ncbi:TonB-dependent receptor [Spongiibacter tropicus]|uniref:TonB-dependent receptor n=1 Tax=Spongiibacter tropicus TaxID=454602 RepID=UPI0003B66392|nr:TonB-dependent receptor [Spongiibacter tropicus]